MPLTPRGSPVVLDARLDDEKVAELLAHGTEYPDLDFKRRIDPTTTPGLIELALDVGARASYRCRYVAKQIAVKIRYTLWVTWAERKAMRQALGWLLTSECSMAADSLSRQRDPI